MSYCPTTIDEMQTLSAHFFQDEAYRSVRTTESILNLNTPCEQTVVFNVSNLFDRISTDRIKEIASLINKSTRYLPQHQYVILYRDDAGTCAGLHGYRTFCIYLNMYRSILPQSPTYGHFYYIPTEEGVPQRDTYVCDVLTSTN